MPIKITHKNTLQYQPIVSLPPGTQFKFDDPPQDDQFVNLAPNIAFPVKIQAVNLTTGCIESFNCDAEVLPISNTPPPKEVPPRSLPGGTFVTFGGIFCVVDRTGGLFRLDDGTTFAPQEFLVKRFTGTIEVTDEI